MNETPVYSECVVGYRHWRIADWLLAPMSVGWPWRVGVNQAKCLRGSGWSPLSTWYDHHENLDTHHSPHPRCECGLYAMHEPIGCGPGIALGAVAMWGNLRVHPTGVRAEFAQIVALANNEKLEDIARLYEVPLVPFEMLQLEAERHGRPLPESIRPEMPPMGDDFPFLTSPFQQALRGHIPAPRPKRLKK